MVLVDTSVWSLALRRQIVQPTAEVAVFQQLIEEGQVQLIGPIRQELLSGIRVQAQFERLRNHLRSFPDKPITAVDYERAADFFNLARAKGVQGSNTDFLICSMAVGYDLPIFTTDKDFRSFQEHLPIQLFQPVDNG